MKSGERRSGLSVAIAEGGASLRGRASAGEGESLPPNLRIDLVPVEKESAENVLRFFETRVDNDGSFAMGNIAPGHYWIMARNIDEKDPATVTSLRQDSTLRVQLLKESAAIRSEIQFQPCQRIVDYELHYPLRPSETKPKP